MNSTELIDNVRLFIDEANQESIGDPDILLALNRAQRKATNIAARKYEDLFWATTTITAVGGQSQYELPDQAAGRRVELVEVRQGSSSSRKINRINNHKRTAYVSRTSTSSLPAYYSMQKNQLELYPTPSDGILIDVHFNKKPEQIILPQGRISSIDLDNNYIILDAVGSSLDTATTGFGSYVNFVDFITGEIKGTAQISAIDSTSGQVTFKTAGLTRTTVLLHTVGTSIPTTVTQDDYVCLVTGTCVPEFPESYANFLIQHAAVSIKRALSEDVSFELEDLKSAEEELDAMWAGRQLSHRVTKTRSHWGSGSLRSRYIY